MLLYRGFSQELRFSFEALGGPMNVTLQILKTDERLVTGASENSRVFYHQILHVWLVVKVKVAPHV